MTNSNHISIQEALKRLQSTTAPSDCETEAMAINVTEGPRGKQLAKPATIKIPGNLKAAEAAVYKYILESLYSLYPTLIPFAIQNRSIVNMAQYYLRYASASPNTLQRYVYGINRYCRWCGKHPDQLINECKDGDGTLKEKVVQQHVQLLEDYLGRLQLDGLAPNTIASLVKAVKALYVKNRIKLQLPHPVKRRPKYSDRAPKPEELQKVIDIAGLREKVIISCLALGGFRIGTLSQLRYYHVMDDLDQGITPLHVHVEADITKGKYADYDTFLGREAVEYIKAYLDVRQRGSPRSRIPPEQIQDTSPLIRSKNSRVPKRISRKQIYRVIHNLYFKAGLIKKRTGGMYRVRPHSIRKFFRTQLAALGVDRDYIDYMMGHKISTYHDIKMKGIEFLRNIYAASGLSIRPKTQVSKIDALKEIVRAWGLNPDEILTKKALSMPHRTFVNGRDREETYIHDLRKGLKEMMRKELLNQTNKPQK